MAKQAVDARHVAFRDGGSVYAIYGPDPDTAGVEVDWFTYTHPWLETRVGLSALGGTGDSNLFGGLNGGARIQSPSRLAPFLGFGIFGGRGLLTTVADDDGRDNDDDGSIDERGERSAEYLGYIAPEAGLHFWLTPTFRLTGSASYNVSTAGSDHNQWMFSFGVSILKDAGLPSDVLLDCGDIDFREQLESPSLRRLPIIDSADAN